MSLRYTCADLSVRARGLTRASQALSEHRLVVVPTETVYGLAADAFSPEGVLALRQARRQAGGAAPPVMVPRPRTLDGIATRVPAAARTLAEAFWPGGLSLLVRSQPTLHWGLGSADTVLVRMPLHPVTLQLLDSTGPLAVTGAFPVGEQAPTVVDDAQTFFGDDVEVYLDCGELPGGAASTVVDATGEVLRVLRHGAVGLDELRSVVPEVLGPDDPEPGEEQEPEPGDRPGDEDAGGPAA